MFFYIGSGRGHRKSWTYNVDYAIDAVCTPLRWLKIETDVYTQLK